MRAFDENSKHDINELIPRSLDFRFCRGKNELCSITAFGSTPAYRNLKIPQLRGPEQIKTVDCSYSWWTIDLSIYSGMLFKSTLEYFIDIKTKAGKDDAVFNFCTKQQNSSENT